MPNLISGPRKQAPSPAPPMGGVGNIFEGESDALMRIGGELRRSGNVLAGAFERRRYIQGVDEYQQAQMALEQKMAKSAENRMLDQNFDTQPKRFRAEMDQWYQSYEFKSNSARKRFRNYYGMNTAREELNIFKAATVKKLNRIDDDQTAMQDINTRNYLNITGEGKEADAARSDLLAEYSKSLDGHVMAGTMSQARVDQHKRAWAILLVQKMIKRQPKLVAETLADGKNVDVIVPPELMPFLKPDDINGLRADAFTEVRNQLAGAKQEYDAAINKGEQELFDKFYIKKDFKDGVELINSILPAVAVDEKKKWIKELGDLIDAELSDEDDPYEKTMNPAKRQELLEKAARDEIDYDDIRKWAGKKDGISTNDYLQIKKVLDDPANIYRSPWAADIKQGIDTAYKLKEATLGGQTEGIPELQAWKNIKYNEMNAFIKKHEAAGTEPTPQQIQEFLSSAIKPAVNHWFREAIMKYLPSPAYQAARLIGTMKEIKEVKAAQGKKMIRTYTNPKTGEKIRWNGKEWETVQ